MRYPRRVFILLFVLAISLGMFIAVLGTNPGRSDITKFWRGDHSWAEIAATATNIDLLASAASVGATTVTLNRAPVFRSSLASYVAVDAFTTNCEIRALAGVSGVTLTVLPLGKAHPADSIIIYFTGNASTAWFGAKADNSTDDSWALLQAVYECGIVGVALEGGGVKRIHKLGFPIVAPPSTKLINQKWKLAVDYAPADTNNAALMSSQGSVRWAFTADASTEVITTVPNWEPPGTITDAKVVFYGTNLPGGLTQGRLYYVLTGDSNTMTISTTPGGSTVNITSAGSGGTVYTEVLSMEKLYLLEFYLDCSDVAGVNGIWMDIQQNSKFEEVRVENCDQIGIKVTGQDGYFKNLQFNSVRFPMDLRDGNYMKIFGLNFEIFDKVILGGTGVQIYGIHAESATNLTGVILDGILQPPLDLIIDGAIWGSGINSSQITFDTTQTSRSPSYILRNWRWLAATDATTNLIAYRDQLRLHTNYVWRDIGNSVHRELKEVIAPNYPDSSVSPDHFGGTIVLSEGGRYWHVGSQRTLVPFARGRIGSTQSTNWMEILGIDNSVRFAVGASGGLRLGLNGTEITNVLTGSATLDFPLTSVGSVADLAITVTGAASGDVVEVGVPPASVTGIVGDFRGFASNNTVFVRFTPTAATQNPDSGTFKVKVVKW